MPAWQNAAACRCADGVADTMAELCQFLRSDNRQLNRESSPKKPYTILREADYRFAELVVAQHVQAIERAWELAAEQTIDANAQPPPKEPDEERLGIEVQALEVSG